MPTEIRVLRLEDADELSSLLRVNREFLARWEPVWPDEFYTAEGQRSWIENALCGHTKEEYFPYVIVNDGQLIGRITLSNIVRYNLQYCFLGYWVSEAHNGLGHASRAVAQISRFAFDELKLHRIEAPTLVANAASQRVLLRSGFERYGLAPKYLKIAGEWQDHVLHQRVNAAD